MSKTAKTIKERAFWHWEYLRRNSEYKQWSEELPVFMKAHTLLGEKIIFTATAYEERRLEELELLRHHSPTIYKSVLESGGNPSNFMFFPVKEFELKFNRLYKHHGIGIDVEKEFNALLSGNEVIFASEELADITALICSYHQWVIRVDGRNPSHSPTFKHMKTLLEHECDNYDVVPYELLALDILKEATLESQLTHLKKLYHDTMLPQDKSRSASEIIRDIEESFKTKKFSNLYAETVSKLTTALKGVNAIAPTRLTMLWMWDEAQKINSENIGAAFEDVYNLLCEKIDNVQIDSLSQFSDNPQRTKEWFFKTDQCIQSMRVLKFGS